MLLWSRGFSFMAHSSTVLFLLLCSQLVVGGVGGDSTPARGNTTTLSCRNISDGDGFTYPVPSYIPSALLQDEDCEREWKNKSGAFFSDGHQANNTRHQLVLNESRKNITVSECIDLNYSVTCHGSNQKFKHTYQVINDMTPIRDVPQQQTDSTNKTIIIIIIIIISSITIGLLIGFLIGVLIDLHKKQRLRVGVWGKRLSGYCQQADESNGVDLRDVRANGDVGTEEA
ncbi:hypothetical protein AMELA_G00175050 [Ameiurus melas]|uniref:Uncharacterized protein n=1 Tax=Ameiurus melas TaxID=219545 RepID=A0A7J6AD23_AMEME|nr:hypothetical protein AMELA_G00175050 [Ameiurus melas]